MAATLDAVAEQYGTRGATVDRLDGVTVELPSGWFNLRPSNTEPLLRLNVGAPTTRDMIRICDNVLAIVRSTQ